MKQIPNLFTLLNLCFGCIALLYVMNGQIDTYRLPILAGQNQHIFSLCVAAFFMFLAGVVDFLDGFVARMFGATSAMGAQLDSLADAVSFGVVPSLIIYQLLKISLGVNWNGNIISFQLLPAFIIACAAVWRLAKFNLDKEQAFYFKGVPTPAAALVIASLPLIVYYNSSLVNVGILFNPYVLYIIIFVISILMVINLPLISLKFKNASLKSNWPKLALLGIAVIGGVFFRWLAVPIVFIAYIILSIFFSPAKK